MRNNKGLIMVKIKKRRAGIVCSAEELDLLLEDADK